MGPPPRDFVPARGHFVVAAVRIDQKFGVRPPNDDTITQWRQGYALGASFAIFSRLFPDSTASLFCGLR